MPAKPDGPQIAAFMKALEKSLDGARNWWPRYVFRSEDVENAARVLNAGELLSRTEARRRGVLTKDCASKGVIGGLPDAEQDWVRLYFRPRAPTQYRNEGIRPVAKWEYDSHMPVPVYLLFKSAPVLGEEGTRFTRGRLRALSPVGSDLAFLQSIPFDDVYHDKGTGKRTAEIVDARHAEVLVQRRLPLDHVRYVVCRSAPERDTLLSLLDQAALARWRPSTIVQAGQRFFYKRGTHVQEVLLEPEYSRFTFAAPIAPDWRGPFALRIDWKFPDGSTAHYERDPYSVDTNPPLRLSLGDHYSRYEVRLTLNGDLAYQGRFEETTEPEVLSTK
jgi:hypothetical protein